MSKSTIIIVYVCDFPKMWPMWTILTDRHTRTHTHTRTHAGTHTHTHRNGQAHGYRWNLHICLKIWRLGHLWLSRHLNYLTLWKIRLCYRMQFFYHCQLFSHSFSHNVVALLIYHDYCIYMRVYSHLSRHLFVISFINLFDKIIIFHCILIDIHLVVPWVH